MLSLSIQMFSQNTLTYFISTEASPQFHLHFIFNPKLSIKLLIIYM